MGGLAGIYCKFRNFREDFIFAKLCSFVTIIPSGNGKITLSFIDMVNLDLGANLSHH